jgi:hypothetical protein
MADFMKGRDYWAPLIFFTNGIDGKKAKGPESSEKWNSRYR